MGGKREHTCKSGRGCFQQCLRTVLFFQGALRHFGLSRRSPQLVVKAFVTHTKKRKKNNKRKKHKAKQGKKTHGHKKRLFCSFFFSKGKGKTRAFDKEKGGIFPTPGRLWIHTMWTNGWISSVGIVGQWERRVVIFYFSILEEGGVCGGFCFLFFFFHWR